LLTGLGVLAALFSGTYGSSTERVIPSVENLRASLPLSFEPNRGQTDDRVEFLARGSDYNLYLTRSEAVLALGRRLSPASADDGPRGAGEEAAALRMRVIGAHKRAPLAGGGKQPGAVNYYLGNDPARWRTGIPLYARVEQRGVYDGIDLAYYGSGGRLEYDFIVAAGADPSVIRVGFEGAESLALDPAGDLLLQTSAGEVRQRKPVVYQELGGERRLVDGGYTLHSSGGDASVGFRLGAYDRDKPLVIDPVLEYSTYLGGSSGGNASGNDDANGIAVDASGRAYIVGRAESVNFPVTNAFDSTLNNGPASSHERDGFIARLNASGTALEYATYVGGLALDVCFSIGVDRLGSAYVGGRTASTDFPTTPGAFQASDPDGSSGLDGIFVKLGPTGALVYSTYIGGSNYDITHGVKPVEDAHGFSAIITGETRSANFPTRNAYQATFGGGGIDAFVMKLNPDPSDSTPGPTDPNDLLYSTFLGDGGDDSVYPVAVDGQGAAYVAGITTSSDFPTTSDAYDGVHNGGADVFLAKVNPNLSGAASLAYSTFLGGSGDEIAYGVAVEADRYVYLSGETTSAGFPTTAGSFDRVLNGASDAFACKLDLAQPAASQLVYSTFLGGSGQDWARSLAIDGAGNAYVTGATTSTDFPVVDALYPHQRLQDAFVVKLNPAGNGLVYSTHLGGREMDEARSIGVDSAGSAYVAGETNSSNFPTTSGAFDQTFGAVGDAWVSKISSAAVQYTVSASPSSAAPGDQLTVSWTAPAGRPANDWIGLFRVGDPNTAALWSQNTGGAASGTFNLNAPVEDGQYEFRYLQAGGFTDVARSNLVTVTSPPPPGSGPITFRSASGGSNGGGSTGLVLALPPGTTSGDVLLAAVSLRNSSAGIGVPAGWTQTINASESGALRTVVYRRVAGGSEPASYTWTFSASTSAAGLIAAYFGVDTATPVEAADGYGNSSSTQITAPGVNTKTAGAVLVNVSSTAVTTVIAPPPGMTERFEQGGTGVALSLNDEPRATVGATGIRRATAGTAARNVGHNVVLKPGAASVPDQYTLTASPSSVAPGGALSVSWTAPAGRPANDWIGLFRVGDPNTAALWSQNTGGAASGTFNLNAPVEDGQYEFRYLQAGGFTDVARSNLVTVTSPGSGEIAFRSASGASNGAGSTALTLPAPAGVASGDVLLAAVAVGGSSVAITAPSGWTQTINASEGSGLRTIVYRRIASASEPAGYIWSFSTSINAVGVVAAYSGVDTASPIDAADGYGSSSSTVITAPGVTTSTPGAWLVNVSSTAAATTIAPPPGMAERAEQGGTRLTVSLNDELRTSAGATGLRRATAGSAAQNVGHNVALRPAGG
jgi:hypothetical protein